MRGVAVQLKTPIDGKKDALGNAKRTYAEAVTVDDVLVHAGTAADSKESNRPEGVVVSYTLYWPKASGGSLRGCLVKVPGDSEWYSVIGDPKATPEGQMARPFQVRNRVVEVTRSDG